MARRLGIIGLLVVLAQLATGCHICRHFHAKWHYKHQGYMGHPYADPCACSCASPASIEPPFHGEQLPIPKKMPAATMTNNPVLTGFNK